jgi:hypothetical protein
VRLGLPDAWIHQDSRTRQLAEAGIDAASLDKALRLAATAPEASAGRAAPGASLTSETVH